MPDRKMVISHFQDAITASGAGNRWRFVRADIIEDAIALLREQERASWILDRLHHYKCSACGAQWGRALNMNYCPTCGQYMEGRDPDNCRYAQDAEEDEE